MQKEILRKDGWKNIVSGSNALRSLIVISGSALYACTLHITYTILPSIMQSFNSQAYYSWVVTTFSIASLLGASLFWKILPSEKPRFSYILSCMIFAIGSFICANAISMFSFLVGRFIQGLGGGLFLCQSYGLVRIIFEYSLWPYGMALIACGWGISIFLGPAIGGLFSQYNNWHGAFWLLSFLPLLIAFIAFFLLPAKEKNDNSTSIVPFGQLIVLTFIILILSIGSLVEQVIYQISSIMLGIILLFFLAFIEKKSCHKILPLGSFSPGSLFFSIYIVIILHMTAIESVELYLPFFMQNLHRMSPLVVGYSSAIVNLGWTLGSIYGAGISSRTLPRLILYSPLLCFIGMIGLFFVVPVPSFLGISSSVLFCFIASIAMTIGIGSGLIWPHLLSSILYYAHPSENTVATTSIVSVQLFCSAFSSTVSGMVANIFGFAEINISTLANQDILSEISHIAKIIFLFSTGIVLISFPCLIRIAAILKKRS